MNQYKTLVLLVILTTMCYSYPLVKNSTDYLPAKNKSCRNSTVILYDRDVEVLKQLMGFVNELMEQKFKKETTQSNKEQENTTTRAATKSKDSSTSNFPQEKQKNLVNSPPTSDPLNLLNLEGQVIPSTIRNVNYLTDNIMDLVTKDSAASKSMDNLSQSISEDKKGSGSNETYEFQASNSLEDRNGSQAFLYKKDVGKQTLPYNTVKNSAATSIKDKEVINPSKYFEHGHSLPSSGNSKALHTQIKGQPFQISLDDLGKSSHNTKEYLYFLNKNQTAGKPTSDRAKDLTSTKINENSSHHNFNSKPQPFQRTLAKEDQLLTSGTDNSIAKLSTPVKSFQITKEQSLKESHQSLNSIWLHPSHKQKSLDANQPQSYAKKSEISKRDPLQSKNYSFPKNTNNEAQTKRPLAEPLTQTFNKSNGNSEGKSFKAKEVSSTVKVTTENSLQHTSKSESLSFALHNLQKAQTQHQQQKFLSSNQEKTPQTSTSPYSRESSLPLKHLPSSRSLDLDNLSKSSKLQDISQGIEEQQTSADSSTLFSHTSNVPLTTYLDNQRKSLTPNYRANYLANSVNLAPKQTNLNKPEIRSPFPKEIFQNLVYPPAFNTLKYDKYTTPYNSPYFNHLPHSFEAHKGSSSLFYPHNPINSQSPGAVGPVLTIPPYIRDIIKNHLNSHSQEMQDKTKPEIFSKPSAILGADLVAELDNPEISPAIRKLIKNHLNSRLKVNDFTQNLDLVKNTPDINLNGGLDLQQLSLDHSADMQLQQEISPYMREIIRNQLNSNLKNYFNNPKRELETKQNEVTSKLNSNLPKLALNPYGESDQTPGEVSEFIRDLIRNQLNDQMLKKNEISKNLYETKKLSTTDVEKTSSLDDEKTSSLKVKSPTTKKSFGNSKTTNHSKAIKTTSKTNSITIASTTPSSILPEFIKQLVERGVLTNVDNKADITKRFPSHIITSTTPKTLTPSTHPFSPLNSFETPSITLSPLVKQLLTNKLKSHAQFQNKIPIFDLSSFKTQQVTSTTTSLPTTVNNIWDEISQKQENKRAIATPTNTTEKAPRKRLCFKTFCFKFQEDKGLYV